MIHLRALITHEQVRKIKAIKTLEVLQTPTCFYARQVYMRQQNNYCVCVLYRLGVLPYGIETCNSFE